MYTCIINLAIIVSCSIGISKPNIDEPNRRWNQKGFAGFFVMKTTKKIFEKILSRATWMGFMADRRTLNSKRYEPGYLVKQLTYEEREELKNLTIDDIEKPTKDTLELGEYTAKLREKIIPEGGCRLSKNERSQILRNFDKLLRVGK